MKTKYLMLSALLLSVLLIKAEIKVASILGDNMVLQRNTEVRLWGKAKPLEKLIISASWSNNKVNTVCNENGEWLVKVKTTEAGGPYTITIKSDKETITLKNILLGEVWLCSGQSNMQMQMEGFPDQPVNNSNDLMVDADNDNVRMFTVKLASMETPQDSCLGKWVVASTATVGKFSAVGYLYAKQLQQRLKVPVGMIASSWSSSRIEPWMSKETISKFPESLTETSKSDARPQHRAYHLYNGMIAPIKNYSIKGAIWYQGESNISAPKVYPDLMVAMVENWRQAFDVGQFPFYFVEIAPYWYNNSKATNTVFLREAQMKASKLIPNSGMVSTVDIGEEKCIHPAEKFTVAKRLTYCALSETYGIKGITYKNPVFKSITIQDSVLLVTFENAPMGLTAFGKEIDNVELAGADKVFYPAKATIVNKKLKVLSIQVPRPVSVRYGFCNFPQGKGFIYNVAGLPVPSFRSDDWEN
jgi:sialate O-acetylesterase